MALSPPSPSVDVPSLVALRAFESAARCGSFSEAAHELHVTAAAIAQHVKAIEQWCGCELFERSARGVTLTQTGANALPLLSSGFNLIADGAHRLRAANSSTHTLRIAALPAIAQIWLPPRLDGLRQFLGADHVSVHAIETAPDLNSDPYDISIFYEPLDTATNGTVIDAPDQVCLVSAPLVAALVATPADIAQHTLILDSSWAHHWALWCDTANIGVATALRTTFSLFSMALDDAIRGHGYLAGRRSLLAESLASGDLVEPFSYRPATGDALVLCARPGPIGQAAQTWASTLAADLPSGH